MRQLLRFVLLCGVVNATLSALVALLIVDVVWMPNVRILGIPVRLQLNALFLGAYGAGLGLAGGLLLAFLLWLGSVIRLPFAAAYLRRTLENPLPGAVASIYFAWGAWMCLAFVLVAIYNR